VDEMKKKKKKKKSSQLHAKKDVHADTIGSLVVRPMTMQNRLARLFSFSSVTK
jgi:hypothetical protein